MNLLLRAKQLESHATHEMQANMNQQPQHHTMEADSQQHEPACCNETGQNCLFQDSARFSSTRELEDVLLQWESVQCHTVSWHVPGLQWGRHLVPAALPQGHALWIRLRAPDLTRHCSSHRCGHASAAHGLFHNSSTCAMSWLLKTRRKFHVTTDGWLEGDFQLWRSSFFRRASYSCKTYIQSSVDLGHVLLVPPPHYPSSHPNHVPSRELHLLVAICHCTVIFLKSISLLLCGCRVFFLWLLPQLNSLKSLSG